MPHIHTQPNQHDMTVSAWVLLHEDNEWKCLVHFHKKMEVLMQIGGHIELDETPWQSMAHEIEEESGFELSQLKALQYTKDILQTETNIAHPVPFIVDTHNVGNGHYHSDMSYGFVATSKPNKTLADGESQDVRWLTIDELDSQSKTGEALRDVYEIYKFLLDHFATYTQVPAVKYSLGKPGKAVATYKRGKAGE